MHAHHRLVILQEAAHHRRQDRWHLACGCIKAAEVRAALQLCRVNTNRAEGTVTQAMASDVCRMHDSANGCFDAAVQVPTLPERCVDVVKHLRIADWVDVQRCSS